MPRPAKAQTIGKEASVRTFFLTEAVLSVLTSATMAQAATQPGVTPEACASGEIDRHYGLDPNVGEEEAAAEERREARALGLKTIPRHFPGLFLGDSNRIYWATRRAIKKFLMGAVRADKRGYGLLLTSAFRSKRAAIRLACENEDPVHLPLVSKHTEGIAFDVHLTDRKGNVLWDGAIPSKRGNRTIVQAQGSASSWYVATLADIMYGDRNGGGLKRLVTEIWHFEDAEGPCSNNICLLHFGQPGCLCNAEGT